jgi:uncharacterized protein YjbI with pentapeptide repeats
MIGANFPTRSWLAQTFEGANLTDANFTDANLTGATCPSGKTYGQTGANC